MLTAAGNDQRASVSIASATSPIKKGGEVFIWYGIITDQSRSSRQHFLREGLPEGCDCTRSTVRLRSCLGSLEIMRGGEMETRYTQGSIVRKWFGLVFVCLVCQIEALWVSYTKIKGNERTVQDTYHHFANSDLINCGFRSTTD